MVFSKLSPKQKRVFRWAYEPNSYAMICDGSVRSGKTAAMSAAFILWAMKDFNHQNFAFCGNTVQSAERNIIMPLMQMTDVTYYFRLRYLGSKHILTVTGGGHENDFYIFGGKDESSYKLVQGITLSGVMFDEVALMPESFVQQTLARTLSVSDARIWFSCNPESPAHWFYQEWILKAEQKQAEHLHFTMWDNPIMTPEKIERTESLYSGVFYDRYVRGLWVVAEGLIYPMWDDVLEHPPTRQADRYALSIDYGTQNAFAAILWGRFAGVWYQIKEYYYSGRTERVQKTDEEYAEDLDAFLESYVPDGCSHKQHPVKFLNTGERLLTIIDPSAASFFATLRKHPYYKPLAADNNVIDGIRETATAFHTGKLKLNPECEKTVFEIQNYVWDKKSPVDKPVKENDHAMDSMRYLAFTLHITKKMPERHATID